MILKLRHWQLLILLIGSVYVHNAFEIIHPLFDEGKKDFYQSTRILSLLPSVLITTCWIFSVVICFRKRLAGIFKVNLVLFIPAFCLAIVFILTGFFGSIMSVAYPVRISVIIGAIILVFYCALTAAKTLKSLETGEEADVNDYFGDAFLFLVPEVGIWFLQPRINKLMGMQDEK
jgi:hypothetical protein